MKKVLVLGAVFLLLFAVNVQAERRSEVKYGGVTGDYWVDLNYINVSDTNFVYKLNLGSQDSIEGSFTKCDILIGYAFRGDGEDYQKSPTNILLSGSRLSPRSNGFVLNLITKKYLLDNLYLCGDNELVIWYKKDLDPFVQFDSAIGFDINEKWSFKSGIRWIQTLERGQVGPTFGLETNF